MEKKGYKKLVNYWQKTAEHDFETMQSLFENKRYDASLFFGHLALEKIIKALVVEFTRDHAPYTHDLLKLAKISGIELEGEDVSLLREVSDFNMEARYPEKKLEFYKICTGKYTEKYIAKIDKFYKKVCQELKQKK